MVKRFAEVSRLEFPGVDEKDEALASSGGLKRQKIEPVAQGPQNPHPPITLTRTPLKVPNFEFPFPYQIFSEFGTCIYYNKKRKTAEYATYELSMEGERLFLLERRYYKDPRILPVRRVRMYNLNEKRYVLFHMIPVGHMNDLMKQYVANCLTNLIPFNGKMNTGPWAAMEREDLKAAKLYQKTIIHVGELRVPPKKGELECYKVLDNKVTILNKIYRARECHDKLGKIHLVCRGFENADPKSYDLDYYNISLSDVWVWGGSDIVKNNLSNICTVNGEPFSYKEFVKKINTEK